MKANISVKFVSSSICSFVGFINFLNTIQIAHIYVIGAFNNFLWIFYDDVLGNHSINDWKFIFEH